MANKAVLQASILNGGSTVTVGASAAIEVRTPAGALASVYGTRAGTGTPGNPFNADANGYFRVYLDPGRYRVIVTTASGSQTFEDVVVTADAGAIISNTTVTGAATADSPDASNIVAVYVNAATATITIPDGVAVGGRVMVKKIHATQGAVTIARSSTDTFTEAALTSVSLNADGDYWMLQKVTATRWDMVDGYKTGSNANGTYVEYASGAGNQRHELTVDYDAASPNILVGLWTYPSPAPSPRTITCSVTPKVGTAALTTTSKKCGTSGPSTDASDLSATIRCISVTGAEFVSGESNPASVVMQYRWY